MTDVTGTTTVRSPLRLHGRDTELAAAHTLMGRLAHGTGGALVCAAGPGLGRTAFLERAVQDFTAGHALLVRAVPAHGTRPHGGIGTLLRAVAAACPHARGAAEGVQAGEPDAVLRLLRAATAARPLLVCVDDVHLWDAPSRTALGRAACSLSTSSLPAGLLLSVAGHRAGDPALAGLPRVRIGPLDGPAAAALLDDLTDGSADPAVREELARAADGSPRLLGELAAGLTPAQLAGRAPLPRPLADPATVLRACGARAAELPPDTRRLLLLAAAAQEQRPAGPGADAALVLRAAGPGTSGAAALAPAESAGLVRTAGDRIHFASEPLRRAVYEAAPLARRRAAHAALAAASEDGHGHRLPYLLHRALAAEGPDPVLAGRLAAAARAVQPHLSHEERAVALAVSARLTAHDTDRAGRLTEAADHARLAGRPAYARDLLAPVRALPAAAPVRGRAELVHGLLSLRDGPVADAREELLLAAALLGPHDTAAALAARLAATEAAWAMGDAAAYVEALGGGREQPGADAGG
ncbi:LuxR family transcriptional regulator, partial [Streptomyces sp. Ru73]